MKHLNHLAVIITCFTLGGCSPSQEQSQAEWQTLFDGTSLNQWDTYLGPEILPGVSSEDRLTQPRLGLNNDTVGVFKIIDLEGEKVLRISGEIWGGISTKQEFENYHVQLQFKWGKLKWFPRDTDSPSQR